MTQKILENILENQDEKLTEINQSLENILEQKNDESSIKLLENNLEAQGDVIESIRNIKGAKDITPELNKIKEAVLNIKETKDVSINNLDKVVEKIGSLETAIKNNKTDNSDVIVGLKAIVDKIKEPKNKNYDSLLGYIADEISSLRDCFVFDSIESILKEIRDKNIDLSTIKIVDKDGKPIDWEKIGHFRGGGSGIAGDQVTQILEGLTEIKDKLIESPSTEANQALQLNRTITGYTTPTTYLLVTGTLDSGTLENAKHQDRTYMVIGEVAGGLEIIYDFTLPTGQKMRRINFCGQYIGGDGHKVDVYIYNYDTSVWDEISTNNFKDILPTENDIQIIWDMDNDDYVNASGNVRIKFEHDGGGDETHSLKIDCISCGDYKSPQLLADVGNKLDDIKTLTNRGYIELQAQGIKVQYDLPDPRVKLANTNDIRCMGDLTDDADFKGINIPIVERFTDFTDVSVTNRLNITAVTPRKTLFIPQIWDDITYRLKHGKTIAFSEMTDKSILQTMIIFPTTVTDTLRIAWRIVPENATQKDFANTAFVVQEITQQGMGIDSYRMAIVNGETDIQIMRAEYSNGGLWIALEWTETSSGISYNGLYKIAFNPDQGFSFMTMVIAKASLFNNSKGIDLTKGKDGDIFYLKRTTSSIAIYKNDNVSPMSYTFGNTYPGYTYFDGTGVMITPYYGDDTGDTLLVANAFTSTSIGVYKMQWVQGGNIFPPEFDLIISGVEMSTSLTKFTQMISLDTGEVQILYYDNGEGDYTSLTNTAFGDTGSYVITYDVVTAQMFVSTDKIYFIFASEYQGNSTFYYITPKDLSTFVEAIVDFDDLNITFSKNLVSGSKFFIMKYISENRIVKNEITYDVDGKAVKDPFIVDYKPSRLHDDYQKVVNHPILVGLGGDPLDIAEIAVGKKSTIGTGAFTIVETDPFIQPSGGDVAMFLQSTSAQDFAGGTGIKECVLEYFSFIWGARKIKLVVPTGITQLALPTDMYRIHKFYGINGNSAAGDITITDISGTILYAKIEQYKTRFERCAFYLAEGEEVTVYQAIPSSTTNGGINIVVFVTEEYSIGKTITRGRPTIEIANNSFSLPFVVPITISNPNNARKAVGGGANGNLSNQKGTLTLMGSIKNLNQVIV